MNHCNKKINTKIYDAGKKIGLNKKDINNILNETLSTNEQTSLAAGPHPPMYTSCLYGTISITDF